MSDSERLDDLKPLVGFAYGLPVAGAVALILGLAAFAAPRPADALPAYAQQTKLACGRCHVSAAGGGTLTAFGKAFAANGHKVPAKSAKPGKASEAVGPEQAIVPSRASSSPWAAPRRCNGWCLRRD